MSSRKQSYRTWCMPVHFSDGIRRWGIEWMRFSTTFHDQMDWYGLQFHISTLIFKIRILCLGVTSKRNLEVHSQPSTSDCVATESKLPLADYDGHKYKCAPACAGPYPKPQVSRATLTELWSLSRGTWTSVLHFKIKYRDGSQPVCGLAWYPKSGEDRTEWRAWFQRIFSHQVSFRRLSEKIIW